MSQDLLGVVLRVSLALAGLLLFWAGLFAALSRRRLDALQAGLFVAGVGVAVLALGLGHLGGHPEVGERVARVALTVSLTQAIAGLAVARAVGTRLRATRTDELERLHG